MREWNACHHVSRGHVTVGVSGVWATVWATTTGAAAIEISSVNGSAGIDHLQTEQWVIRKTTPQNPQAGGSHSRPSQISQVFSQQLLRLDAESTGSGGFFGPRAETTCRGRFLRPSGETSRLPSATPETVAIASRSSAQLSTCQRASWPIHRFGFAQTGGGGPAKNIGRRLVQPVTLDALV